MIYKDLAFVAYQPGPPGTLTRVNVNSAAETILAYIKDPSGKTLPSRESAIALCSRWVTLLEKASQGAQRLKEESKDGLPLIDVLKSHRRKYEVHGTVLDGRLLGAVSRYPSFVFILMRADPSSGTLQRIFREKRLSPRERDLVRFLFSDMSNKEIAQAMGLSTNTVKGYLKSLALKLGVSSRIGILAALYQVRTSKIGLSRGSGDENLENT